MSTEKDPRHGLTSASSAEADQACPGRFLAQRGVPEEGETSADAITGREIHSALAGDTGAMAGLSLAQIGTMDDCIKIERAVLSQVFKQAIPKSWREERLWVQIKTPDGRTLAHSGQPDVVYRVGNRILIIEYKTLTGDVADGPANLQLRDQVVLVAGKFLVYSQIFAVVIQPLVTHTPELAVYSPADVKMSEQNMFARIAASHNPESPRIPGEAQCKFCRAQMNCPEYQQWAGAMVPVAQSLIAVPVTQWTPQQRALFCDQKAVAEKWLENCEAAIKRMLAADPNAVPGWKLKPGQNREAITNAGECFHRFSALGGTMDQFLAVIGVGKGKLEEAVAGLLQIKGKALGERMETLLNGITEKTPVGPSLKKQ